MKKSLIGRNLATALLLASTAPVLDSCSFVTKNLSFMTDTMSEARPDDVVVEKGSGGAAAISSDAPPAIVSPAAASGYYMVQHGDTLSSIARKNGVSLATLCSANGMTKDSTLRSGQKLRIPRAATHATTAASSRTTKAVTTVKKKTVTARMTSYKVKAGETLSGIARRHNTTVSAILKANRLKADQADHIRDGRTLKIPAGR